MKNLIGLLVLRDLLKQKWPFVLQAMSIAVVFAALNAAEQIQALQLGSSVAGSLCSNDLFVLSAKQDGHYRDALSVKQAKALARAIPDYAHSISIVGNARISTRSYDKIIRTDYVDPNYFDVTCVARRDLNGRTVDAPFAEGVIVNAPTLTQAKLTSPVQYRATQSSLISGSVGNFAGLDGRQQSRGFSSATRQGLTDAWVPISAFSGEAGRASLVVRIPNGEAGVGALERRLSKFARLQKAEFSSDAQIVASHPTLGLIGLSQLRLAVWFFRIFGIAFAFMAVVNVCNYQFSRLPHSKATAHTLKALGAPPRELARFAFFEPLLLLLPALVVGGLLCWILTAFAQSLLFGEIVALPAINVWPLAFLGAFVLLLVLVRWRSFTGEGSPQRGKAQRTLFRFLPILLLMQVAISAATLSIGGYMVGELYRDLPPAPNFPLGGLSVISFRQQAVAAPIQNNLGTRWNATWAQAHIRGYSVALSKGDAPFLPGQALSTMRLGNEAILFRDVEVSSNFFEILGIKEAQQPIERNQLVANQVLADHLQTLGFTSGATVYLADSEMGSERALMFALRIDDGLVAKRSRHYDFKVRSISDTSNSLSPTPTGYRMLEDGLLWSQPLYLFVRHPSQESPELVAAKLLPSLRTLMPSVEIESAERAVDLFEAPMKTAREVTVMVGVLAIASFIVGVFGLMALLSLLLQSLKVESALHYAVGCSRGQVVMRMTKQAAIPYLAGLMIVTVPALGWAALFSDPGTAGASSWLGPLLAASVLLATLIAVLWIKLKPIQQQNFMDWLRYE